MAGDGWILVIQSPDLGEIPAELERKAARNMARAINVGADKGRTLAQRAIEKQVAFPAGYVDPGSGRLYVSKRANEGSLLSTISARQRATSLARFTSGAVPVKGAGRQQGVYVTVKPGLAKYLRTAFLLPLRSGNADTLNNLGLAVRSVGKPEAAYKPKSIGNNLWLLYGPSVGSVFQGEEGRGVRDLIMDDVVQAVNDEYNRLMEADIG